jgi:hypothetical protein
MQTQKKEISLAQLAAPTKSYVSKLFFFLTEKWPVVVLHIYIFTFRNFDLILLFIHIGQTETFDIEKHLLFSTNPHSPVLFYQKSSSLFLHVRKK